MRIAVWTFAANLKSIARLAAEIQLFLFRVTDYETAIFVQAVRLTQLFRILVRFT